MQFYESKIPGKPFWSRADNLLQVHGAAEGWCECIEICPLCTGLNVNLHTLEQYLAQPKHVTQPLRVVNVLCSAYARF